MGIFDKIKGAIFGHHRDPQAGNRTADPAGGPPVAPQSDPQAGTTTAAPPAAPTQSQQPVDVEAVLADISRQRGNPDLNYKTSIVDLMKLLGIDSSLENRKELAHELGYTGALDGSAEMNIWLHKETMRQLAVNGGNVPASFLS
jgi:hypothetical protein